MLSKPSQALKDSGVFLFSKEKEILISIQDSLLVTFRSPSSRSVGVILHHSSEPRSELTRKLDALFKKYFSLSDVDSNLIQAKIFGRGEKHSSSLVALKSWLNRHKVPVVASALGRTLPNEVTLICSTGKVGIQYQRDVFQEKIPFLSSGTARQRNPSLSTIGKVLVLSPLPAHQSIIKQCIEEQPLWEAVCQQDFHPKKLSSLFRQASWFAVVISSELQEKPETLDILRAASQEHPKLQFRWIGNEMPKEAASLKNWKLLPPVDPLLLPQFKKLLKQALLDYQFAETSETLLFPRKKTK